MYTDSFFNYKRRQTLQMMIGQLAFGGSAPIRVQSMGNTDTNDMESSVAQTKRIVEAGGELIRFTTQGVREAKNLTAIHAMLRSQGVEVPLAADVHFNPKVALEAAKHLEKVRINPGNFVAGKDNSYTSEEFDQELMLVRERLLPLIAVCKERGTVLRIGVNHGSLSLRMMDRYGDTPEGLAASCMEFLSLCKAEGFNNLVLSIKASNTLVMVQSVRLLVAKMNATQMHYPLHLGVTEAGNGEDGRIKSAVGIGALLSEGIGDTIRVSLSEDPELEIPVAKLLVEYITARSGHPFIEGQAALDYNPYAYNRRKTHAVERIGGSFLPVVLTDREANFQPQPDYVLEKDQLPLLKMTYADLTEEVIDQLRENRDSVILLTSRHQNPVGEMQAFFHRLLIEKISIPVILGFHYKEDDLQSLQIKVGADLGLLLLNGFGDGIYLTNESENISDLQVNSIAFAVLQAARVRVSRTEYIACPSCGRTLFDLQSTLGKVKEATAHLKNLKIAVMGCIVNGPGEMADADYGYVGAGKGRVSLYKGKQCIEKNIPEEQAIERLMATINYYEEQAE